VETPLLIVEFDAVIAETMNITILGYNANVVGSWCVLHEEIVG
jgi:hypothetical protein